MSELQNSAIKLKRPLTEEKSPEIQRPRKTPSSRKEKTENDRGQIDIVDQKNRDAVISLAAYVLFFSLTGLSAVIYSYSFGYE